ncbi:MAG: hypothetical protein CMO30_16465 [Tistrella sp.]|nr:hypothetical protein [Tistrella sp.]MBA76865.1 hypothetical protein [Tistrella sp.]
MSAAVGRPVPDHPGAAALLTSHPGGTAAAPAPTTVIPAQAGSTCLRGDDGRRVGGRDGNAMPSMPAAAGRPAPDHPGAAALLTSHPGGTVAAPAPTTVIPAQAGIHLPSRG